MVPLIGSPSGIQLENLTWELNTVTAQTTVPHGYSVGSTIDLTISGVTPSGYNGIYECLITGDDLFTYELSSYPGSISNLGSVSYDINLAGGYFTTSTLIYRDAAQWFEVNP